MTSYLIGSLREQARNTFPLLAGVCYFDEIYYSNYSATSILSLQKNILSLLQRYISWFCLYAFLLFFPGKRENPKYPQQINALEIVYISSTCSLKRIKRSTTSTSLAFLRQNAIRNQNFSAIPNIQIGITSTAVVYSIARVDEESVVPVLP
jgi:hypothetical protein